MQYLDDIDSALDIRDIGDVSDGGEALNTKATDESIKDSDEEHKDDSGVVEPLNASLVPDVLDVKPTQDEKHNARCNLSKKRKEERKKHWSVKLLVFFFFVICLGLVFSSSLKFLVL